VGLNQVEGKGGSKGGGGKTGGKFSRANFQEGRSRVKGIFPRFLEGDPLKSRWERQSLWGERVSNIL